MKPEQIDALALIIEDALQHIAEVSEGDTDYFENITMAKKLFAASVDNIIRDFYDIMDKNAN